MADPSFRSLTSSLQLQLPPTAYLHSAPSPDSPPSPTVPHHRNLHIWASDTQRQREVERDMETQHFNHDCPLTSIPNDRPINDVLVCKLCGTPIFDNSAYACSKCNIFFHISCADSPPEINHPFHPQHPLTCIYAFSSFTCHACGCRRFLASKYQCSRCEFNLDLDCASLKPIANHGDELPYNNSSTSPPVHPHPLIPCAAEKNSKFYCSCENLIEGTIYVCLQCKFLLHKTCTQLPYEIQHPFHPRHPLVLAKARTTTYHEYCKACLADFGGFTYCCAKCKFSLDTECASLKPIVKFKLHHHPLAYLTVKSDYVNYGISCVSCRRNKCRHFFRCIPCNFNLHLHCVLTLPLTRKHRCHRHTLTLTRSPVKDSSDDDDDTEMYCDVCEKERHLPDPTYYCAEPECHIVAHVHCMISKEDIVTLGEEPCVVEFSREIEADETTDSKLVELDKEIETLRVKLETLKQERAHLISSSTENEE